MAKKKDNKAFSITKDTSKSRGITKEYGNKGDDNVVSVRSTSTKATRKDQMSLAEQATKKLNGNKDK